jgi:hypothetical protein
MKLSTLLILGLLGFIAWRLWQFEQERAVSQLVPGHVPVLATPTPFPERSAWKREELVLVRGAVLAKVPEGLIVETIPKALPRPTPQLPRGANTTDAAARRAQALQAAEENDFGATHETLRGKWVNTDFEPRLTADGLVLVVAYPNTQSLPLGTKIKVVTAPLQNLYPYQGIRLEAFTVGYDLEAEKAGGWMWKQPH